MNLNLQFENEHSCLKMSLSHELLTSKLREQSKCGRSCRFFSVSNVFVILPRLDCVNSQTEIYTWNCIRFDGGLKSCYAKTPHTLLLVIKQGHEYTAEKQWSIKSNNYQGSEYYQSNLATTFLRKILQKKNI
jgi:hypothetical protein